MASFNFTYPLGEERGCVFAELDVTAEVEENEEIEIFLYDHESRKNADAPDEIAKAIVLWLRAHEHYSRIIHENAEDERRGRVVYHRKVARSV